MIYGVNLIGPFQMIRAFSPMLNNSQSAAVVNVSSIAPLIGGGSSIAYIASKGASNALSLTLARVLGPKIRVNVVAPGMVDSPWLRKGLGAERFELKLRSYETASALASTGAAGGSGGNHLLPERRGHQDHRRGPRR